MTQAVVSMVAEFGSGVSPAEIARAQDELGVVFPPCYVSFLREFGWARLGRVRVHGLGADVPPALDLLAHARARRAPAGLLHVIGDGGADYFLDIAATSAGHCPVVLLDRTVYGVGRATVIADDFGEWLVGRLTLLR